VVVCDVVSVWALRNGVDETKRKNKRTTERGRNKPPIWIRFVTIIQQ
jgi:hypothetical protein